MRGLIVRGAAAARGGRSAVALRDLPEPAPGDGDLLVETLWLGVCATDRRLRRLGCRRLPEGEDWLVLGHEVVARVADAAPESGFTAGDLVCGIVRRPDPQPCSHCAAGEPDLCSRSDYTERGILGRHGYGAERFRLESSYAVRIDPGLGPLGVLVEPASVAAKAWERIDRVSGRGTQRVLVVGCGPIGSLAALLGVQRGHEVHVMDRVAAGPKPRLIAALGATYHRADGDRDHLDGTFDIVLECVGGLLWQALARTAANGTLCVVAGGGHADAGPDLDGESLSWDLVWHNKSIIGVVSSNRRHFEAAQHALLGADPGWVRGLITQSVPLPEWERAFDQSAQEIKSVIEFRRP